MESFSTINDELRSVLSKDRAAHDAIVCHIVLLQSAMVKIKELTPRGTYQTLEKTLEEVNSWYVGWAGYFEMTYYPAQLKKIKAHVRRRLRSRLVDQQKSKRNLYRKLIKRGASRRQSANVVFSNRKRW
ncbi:MAG: hypothetical protein GY820_34215, partial [Gammaproteobacteria bacterium]|nr:hypothetical protein [Gammaproteobacteria bacterium]